MHSITYLGRRLAALTGAAALFALAACSSDSPVGAAPKLPDNPTIPPQYRGAAFIMDVSTLKKTVKITAPTATIKSPSGQLSIEGKVLSVDSSANYSLLGADVIDLTSTNFVAGAVGAAVPGKV